MANLIEYIQGQIYENSTEDITGSIMQQVLTRMVSDEGVINVHTVSGQSPFAVYSNAQAARDAVPAGFKKLGLVITYKLAGGWFVDEYIGTATSGWSTASNWKCLGPISVSQNAQTGKTTITIGSESFDVATQPVSVSQNTITGHTDISVGGVTTPVASVEDVANNRLYTNNKTANEVLKECYIDLGVSGVTLSQIKLNSFYLGTTQINIGITVNGTQVTLAAKGNVSTLQPSVFKISYNGVGFYFLIDWSRVPVVDTYRYITIGSADLMDICSDKEFSPTILDYINIETQINFTTDSLLNSIFKECYINLGTSGVSPSNIKITYIGATPSVGHININILIGSTTKFLQINRTFASVDEIPALFEVEADGINFGFIINWRKVPVASNGWNYTCNAFFNDIAFTTDCSPHFYAKSIKAALESNEAIINDDIKALTLGSINIVRYYALGYHNGTGITTTTDTKYKYLLLPVSEGDIYLFYNYGRKSNMIALMPDLTHTTQAWVANVGQNTIHIPSGINYLYLGLEFNANVDYTKEWVCKVNPLNEKDLIPDGELIAVDNHISNERQFEVFSIIEGRTLEQALILPEASIDSEPCMNFNGAILYTRNTAYQTKINDDGDNIPAFYFGNWGNIGGNHGLPLLYKATINGHGKTFADVGSAWRNSDDDKTYFIVDIYDENNIGILGEPYGEGASANFYHNVAQGITFTHIEGATNTSSFTIGSAQRKHWHPAENIITQKLLVDNKDVVDGYFVGKQADLLETYDLYNPVSYLEKIVENVGNFTTHPMPQDLNVSVMLRVCNDYRFSPAGLVAVITDISVFEEIPFTRYANLNVKLMTGSAFQYYLPKALPITVNGVNYDYRVPATYPRNSVSREWGSSDWENPLLPPDRAILFRMNGGARYIGLHHGYLFDQGIGGNTRKDFLNVGWWCSDAGASYNGALDTKIGNILSRGEHYGFACFRKYDLPPTQSGLINISQFEINNRYYIYVDAEAEGVYTIPIPSKWRGHGINVLEKRGNVELLNDMASTELTVLVNTDTIMYGYLVAEIK